MGIKQEEYYLFKYKPFKEFSWSKAILRDKTDKQVKDYFEYMKNTYRFVELYKITEIAERLGGQNG